MCTYLVSSHLSVRYYQTLSLFVLSQIYSIIRHTAELLDFESDEQFEDFYDRTAWTLDTKYRRSTELYPASYDIFKKAIE